MSELLPEHQLVEQARRGDTEAFGELTLIYRRQAVRWAEGMTHDRSLAEDIVQDAFVQAYLQIHTLKESGQFVPWLYRILSNYVRMRMRRGGPYRRERPFSSWADAGNGDRDGSESAGFLAEQCSSAFSLQGCDIPEQLLLNKELLNDTDKYLGCLNEKEREVFEASCLHQRTPQEIAADLNMTVPTVYTYMYRSRQKIERYYKGWRIDAFRDGSVTSRTLSRRTLRLPVMGEKETKSVLVNHVSHMLLSAGYKVPLCQLMGESGFAFRMKVFNQTTFSDGIYIFDWHEEVKKLFRNTGFEVSIVSGQISHLPVPVEAAVERFPVVTAEEDSVLPFIRTAIRSGNPVLFFDTHTEAPVLHDWSLLCGYDDKKRTCSLAGGGTRTYLELISSPVRFMAAISGRLEWAASQEDRLIESLRFAVNYAREGCSYRPLTPYVSYTSGLAAYAKWIQQLHNPHLILNRHGLGHMAMVYADSRKHAARYLQDRSEAVANYDSLAHAAELYAEVSGDLDRLCTLVPFGECGPDLTWEIRQQCVEYLTNALKLEEQAVACIESVLARWTEERNDNNEV
ncbi:RNA polymerase sigma factor [Paenibacillus tarimensis]|uniref:RNA polymerase sigma factor n=1 Tax=Paenibacillus tarimensis TaxID=416012 RepID=UPI001F46505C|nr:sigma-70 family RNA polymerase sigma factor [Paenibacillus tarimensis]MCF2945147.1 sigma-70 family RNA polymerase sigma factor [Paenibacillus tarimensis]